MTHSLHRHGTESSLKGDYTFIVRACEVNRDGCAPKLQQLLQLFLSEEPVNIGCNSVGKGTIANGLDLNELAKAFDRTFRFACVLSSKEKVQRILKKLKAADVGISITIGGLIDEIVEMSREAGLKPHTANISLGLFGSKKSQLPGDKILSTTTMCGHGLIATRLAEKVFKKIETGALTPREGALALAEHCPCAIFNMDRFEEILDRKEKKP